MCGGIYRKLEYLKRHEVVQYNSNKIDCELCDQKFGQIGNQINISIMFIEKSKTIPVRYARNNFLRNVVLKSITKSFIVIIIIFK